jgi:hypothetical protein
MATIDLGKIKIVWKGTYAGGTAYVVDEAVVHNGTSYICIANTTGNAPPNNTYWNVLAQAGTNGTDLTSTLTTQGDIVYRDGSGLQRLAAGTSGQFLKTLGSGANPSWGTVESGLTEVDAYRLNAGFSGAANPITNWTRVNENTFSKVGTGVTVSSGTWSFGATGVYLVRFDASLYISNTNVRYVMIGINTTNDNSTYNGYTEQYSHMSDTSGVSYTSISTGAIMNVTNTSTHKFRLRCAYDDSNVHMEGGANESYTQVQVIRLGASV